MENSEIVERLTEVDQRSRSNTHRLDKLEDEQEAVNQLALSVQSMANEQSHMKTDLSEVKTDVKALSAKSGKRWDDLVEKIIWLIIGGALSALISQVV